MGGCHTCTSHGSGWYRGIGLATCAVVRVHCVCRHIFTAGGRQVAAHPTHYAHYPTHHCLPSPLPPCLPATTAAHHPHLPLQRLPTWADDTLHTCEHRATQHTYCPVGTRCLYLRRDVTTAGGRTVPERCRRAHTCLPLCQPVKPSPLPQHLAPAPAAIHLPPRACLVRYLPHGGSLYSGHSVFYHTASYATSRGSPLPERCDSSASVQPLCGRHFALAGTCLLGGWTLPAFRRASPPRGTGTLRRNFSRWALT